MITEQKTAEEILNDISVYVGYVDFEASLRYESGDKRTKDLVLTAMKEYAKLKCREQREICLKSARVVSDFSFTQGEQYYVSESSIRNAREPEI